MAILTKGQTFANADSVTSTKLNNLVDAAAFVAGASGTTDNTSLEVNGSGRLQVKDLGISSAKIANLTVTAAKIADTTITPTKLSTGAPSWNDTTLNVVNSLDFSPVVITPATTGTYGRAATTGLITVTMTAHGMATGNIALLDFSENAGVAATDGSYVVTVTGLNTFTVVDTVANPTAIASGTAVSRTNYYGNANIRGSSYIAGDSSVSGSLSVSGSEIKPLILGTAVATTSGTSVDFTVIPSWVKRITFMLDGVSTNGTSPIIIQLGDSGGIEITDYYGSASEIKGTPASTSFTTGFGLVESTAAGDFYYGIATIVNVSGNLWVYSFTGSSIVASQTYLGGGSKTLSATLDRIRLTTSGGANTFDAGTVNIMYE